MSGQKRLVQNDLTAKGKEDSINEALSQDIDEKANSIKEIPCDENYK